MKKLLIIALIAGGLWYLWTRLRPRNKAENDLANHLAQDKVQREIGSIALGANIGARPAPASVNARGPLDSVVFDIFQRLTPNQPVWLLN